MGVLKDAVAEMVAAHQSSFGSLSWQTVRRRHEAEHKIEELDNRFASMDGRLSEALMTADDLRAANVSLAVRLDEAMGNVASLRAEAGAVRQELAEATRRVEEVTEDRDTLERDRDELERKLGDCRVELRKADASTIDARKGQGMALAEAEKARELVVSAQGQAMKLVKQRDEARRERDKWKVDAEQLLKRNTELAARMTELVALRDAAYAAQAEAVRELSEARMKLDHAEGVQLDTARIIQHRDELLSIVDNQRSELAQAWRERDQARSELRITTPPVAPGEFARLRADLTAARNERDAAVERARVLQANLDEARSVRELHAASAEEHRREIRQWRETVNAAKVEIEALKHRVNSLQANHVHVRFTPDGPCRTCGRTSEWKGGPIRD